MKKDQFNKSKKTISRLTKVIEIACEECCLNDTPYPQFSYSSMNGHMQIEATCAVVTPKNVIQIKILAKVKDNGKWNRIFEIWTIKPEASFMKNVKGNELIDKLMDTKNALQ